VPPAKPEPLLSPRQVAEALGVSESSVKRWSDDGLIATQKTAGGHRKLALAEVLRFVRAQGYAISRPELLGLAHLPRRPLIDDDARAQLWSAISIGDGPAIRRMLTGLFVHGEPLAAIFDHLLTPALHRLGSEWEHGEVLVFEEHRAIALLLTVLHDLRLLLPARGKGHDPLAVVATLSGDPYTIAITMTELTLVDAGWAAVNLGPDNPPATMVEAVNMLKPRLLCLGINVVPDVAQFASGYAAIAEAARDQRTALVIGGPLTSEVRSQIRYAACCTSMRELADFAIALEP